MKASLNEGYVYVMCDQRVTDGLNLLMAGPVEDASPAFAKPEERNESRGKEGVGQRRRVTLQPEIHIKVPRYIPEGGRPIISVQPENLGGGGS